MFSDLTTELQNFTETSKQFIPPMLMVIGGLWAFNLLNWATGSRLTKLGIRPRKIRGLIGIIFAPFLHADFSHLLFNTVPLFFLGLFVMSMDLMKFFWATLIINLIAGLGVWIVARRGNHIGASALIAGYFGYILASAYKQPTITTIFCAAIALYYFGSILFSLFPTQKGTSWEGHLCGFIGGLAAFLICQYYGDWLNQLIA